MLSLLHTCEPVSFTLAYSIIMMPAREGNLQYLYEVQVACEVAVLSVGLFLLLLGMLRPYIMLMFIRH